MYRTTTIEIGTKKLGGGFPLLIQSMTNTDTNDVEATVDQCIRIFDRGADMVRITTQTLKEVESLRHIRERLRRAGYSHPLVADVHFQPRVAIEAAKVVEKVRINPGNYIPPKYTGPKQYDIIEKQRQMDIIHEKLLPLINVCHENGTALRIGVNHGSLSERILNWYGNTPEGMVASAMEFLEIFRSENFDRIVLSLKASSVRLMVQANRLMVKRMEEEGMSFPLHLGVTEAGDEEEGRIKSATGICSLLADGIGDTIRVSLTEDPEDEIPVARAIAEIGRELAAGNGDFLSEIDFFDPYFYSRRNSYEVKTIGADAPPVVISNLPHSGEPEIVMRELDMATDNSEKTTAGPMTPDFVFIPERRTMVPMNEVVPRLFENGKTGITSGSFPENPYPVFTLQNKDEWQLHHNVNFLKIEAGSFNRHDLFLVKNSAIVLILESEGNFIREARQFFRILKEEGMENPVILHRNYTSGNPEELMVRASAELGALFLDGLGDGIWIVEKNPDISLREVREISFSILQACGSRISRTEYIACPSCGRTLFNIQESLKKVKSATSGYKGLKIAVMGCIVNGPGEMADADFGYVGAGPGKITLYKGKEPVMKNIPEDKAVEELLKLIEKSWQK